MEFLNGRALDADGEELIRLGSVNGKFRVYVGGQFIGDYKTEDQAFGVKKTLDEALEKIEFGKTASRFGTVKTS